MQLDDSRNKTETVDATGMVLDCMRDVLNLGPKGSNGVGPLAVPVESAPDLSQPAQPTRTEERPQE